VEFNHEQFGNRGFEIRCKRQLTRTNTQLFTFALKKVIENSDGEGQCHCSLKNHLPSKPYRVFEGTTLEACKIATSQIYYEYRHYPTPITTEQK